MKANGIIAEYNPFHNGHLYQLQESARLTGCDYTVVVMSGNFVQRGAPALADKRMRAETALRCGADLVLELPVLYATASAEFFAAGAVALLDRLNVVTHLCFGSECGDAKALGQIAQALSREPSCYRAALKDSLKKGSTYPAARVQALAASARSSLPRRFESLLASPNNILAVEYIRALSRQGSRILPVTVRRLGAGYHDTGLEGAPAPGNACSALALRQAMHQGGDLAQLSPHMPPEAFSLLSEYLDSKKAIYSDDFSSLLYYKLILEEGNASGYEKYLDVSPGLSDRIGKHVRFYDGFEAFCDMLKTKDMTYTRISRCLLHILLGIEKADMELGKALGHAPYARVLGFRRCAAPLLAAVRERSGIPLVTKVPDARKSLTPEAGRLLELDILAGRLYREIARTDKTTPLLNEISAPPVIL